MTIPTQPAIELVKHVSAPRLTRSRIQHIWQVVKQRVSLPSRWRQVSVVVVGAAEMKQLNQRYRHDPTVTDVLSFPYGTDGGEIVLCYPQAKRQSAAKQVSLTSELDWLLVHGFLHVLGYDHEQAKDAQVMRPLEQAILAYV
ncbi:MAG: hypothetical protein ACD_41C00358G0003 [uncultured bacterium]|nr:MAG: hypothetical protein ACD_41C00358G0003 [uncultured bacterium]